MFPLSAKQRFLFEGVFSLSLLAILLAGWGHLTQGWVFVSALFLGVMGTNAINAWRQWSKES